MSEVVATAQWLADIAIANNLPQDVDFALQVCVEETLSNIVRYGGNLTPRVEIEVKIKADRVELTIDDDCKPFDVTKASPRKVMGDINAVEPGGLGVGLVHKFASNLQYQRGPLGNRLLITFERHRRGVADAVCT